MTSDGSGGDYRNLQRKRGRRGNVTMEVIENREMLLLVKECSQLWNLEEAKNKPCLRGIR